VECSRWFVALRSSLTVAAPRQKDYSRPLIIRRLGTNRHVHAVDLKDGLATKLFLLASSCHLEVLQVTSFLLRFHTTELRRCMLGHFTILSMCLMYN